MDISALQQQQSALTATLKEQQSEVDTTQSQLDAVNTELTEANLVNQLEALTPEQVASLNTALGSDAQNTSGITVVIPTPPAQAS